MGKLADLIKIIRCINDKIPIVLNTSNYEAENEALSLVDNVSMSVHHYDINKNNELFGRDSLMIGNRLASMLRSKLHVSCNLIKGYIDSVDEIFKFVSEMSKVGVRDFGFVGLMKVNGFCQEHYIDTQAIHKGLALDSRFRSVRKYHNADNTCLCGNYLVDCDNMPTIYVRHVLDTHCNNQSILVYDVDNNLRQGFDGKIIASFE